MRNLGLFILQQRRNAAAIALICALLPFLQLPIGWACSVIVGLVTLTKGPKDGFWVTTWVALPAVALLYLGSPGLMITLVVARCLLVLGLAWLLKRTHSWRLVLETITFLGLVAVILVHLFMKDPALWWAQQINQYTNLMITTLNLNINSQSLTPYVDFFAKFATGILVLFVFSLDLLTLFLARWWQSIIIAPTVVLRELHTIRASYLSVCLLLLASIGFYLKLPIAYDALPVVLFPLAIAGLSLIHYFLANKTSAVMVLTLVYLAIIFFLPYTVVLLAIMGLIDGWYDFRSRLSYIQT